MTIEFSWGTGKFIVNADNLIKDMSLVKYQKWVRLFAQYGDPQDHMDFLQLLDDHITHNEAEYHSKLADHKTWIYWCDHPDKTDHSPSHCRNMRRLSKGELNTATDRLRRCRKMRDILKGLIG